MPKRRTSRDPLLLRVCAELGAGRITEAYIHDPGWATEGLTEGKQITINPAHATVNVVLHECLHRLFPHWSERTVRAKTTYLCRRLTDSEVQAIYAEYQARKNVRRTVKRAPQETER